MATIIEIKKGMQKHTLFKDVQCSQADKRIVISKRYTDTCIHERNEYMVNNASLVIAITDGRPGGTMKTVRYAQSKNKKVILIRP